MSRTLVAGLLLTLSAPTTIAAAATESTEATPRDAGFPVDSFLHLRKNTNRNQVHYRVHVDEQCRPLKRKPLEAYWRVLEEGPDVTEGLAFWEQPGYGVRQPEEVVWHEQGGTFAFGIRGVPEQKIELETFRANADTDAECRARATTTIAGAPARFDYIAIEVSGWANVHRVEIFGADDAGNTVQEVTHQE